MGSFRPSARLILTARRTKNRRAFLAIVTAALLGLGGLEAVQQTGDTLVPEQATSKKTSRTAAQKKIGSQLLLEIDRLQGHAADTHVPPGKTGVRLDAKGRALVDVRAEVTATLTEQIDRLGGSIVSTEPAYRSTIAWIPLLKLEELARDPVVVAIRPKAQAATRGAPPS